MKIKTVAFNNRVPNLDPVHLQIKPLIHLAFAHGFLLDLNFLDLISLAHANLQIKPNNIKVSESVSGFFS